MHVKNKALAVVSLIILVLSGFYLLHAIAHQDREIESMIEREEEVIDDTVGAIERYSLHSYRIKIQQLAEGNADLRAAFADQDREELYRLALPIYENLLEENSYFHAWDFNLPDGTVFLRVQKPDLHGENLVESREIIQQVHRDRLQYDGYDVGKHGTIYWVVQPIFHGGEYIGAMEFGIPVTQLIVALEQRFQTEVATIVRADRWRKAVLTDQGYRHFNDYVLIAREGSRYDRIPDDFIFSLDCDQELTLEGRRHILHNCSVLLDYKGETVGYLLILQDISEKVASHRRFIVIAVGLTGTLIGLSLLMLYFSFGTLIGNLENYAEENKRAKEEIELARNELEHRVHDRTADLRKTNETLEREITERAKVEEALRDTHERLLLVLDGLEANVYVADMKTYDILFINRSARENFGDVVGKKCWQTFQSGQRAPCSFCTNDQLVDADGAPAGSCTWEFQNTDQGKWYIIQDRAIRWVDGRVVRLAIATEITERKKSEERIRASLREKEVLLKEIHHRVKNNMQIISSLLNLESASVGTGDGDVFRDSQSRIKAMSLIHEKLYRSEDITNIALQDYIESMVDSLYALYGVSKARIRPEIRAEGVVLGMDTAVLCGLIVNELVANSLRHAFPGTREGGITIAVSRTGGDGREGDGYDLVVHDDGIGIPQDVSLKDPRTLGLQLVSMLAEHQLQGRVFLERNGGARFSVRFRELKYRKRT